MNLMMIMMWYLCEVSSVWNSEYLWIHTIFRKRFKHSIEFIVRLKQIWAFLSKTISQNITLCLEDVFSNLVTNDKNSKFVNFFTKNSFLHSFVKFTIILIKVILTDGSFTGYFWLWKNHKWNKYGVGGWKVGWHEGGKWWVQMYTRVI